MGTTIETAPQPAQIPSATSEEKYFMIRFGIYRSNSILQ